MADNISAHRQDRIVFSTGRDSKSIEFGCSAVDDGLLRHFSGPTLAILIYLLTHLEEDQTVATSPAIIASYLSPEYDLASIRAGLERLCEQGLIAFPSRKEGEHTCSIRVRLDIICGERVPEQGNAEGADKWMKTEITGITGSTENTGNSGRPSELAASLQAFFPEGSAPDLVDEWLVDFEPAVLKELVRRVDKWLQNTGNPPEKAAPYLLSIIEDWYRKEIFTYRRLQHFDHLYRETKELAECYGIRDWNSLNPIQLEAFRSWLSGKNPLSLEVARLAIQEAVLRKKDGQPSLKYIEDNFIKPWKKAGIKNTAEARQFLRARNRPRSYGQADRRWAKDSLNKGYSAGNKGYSGGAKGDGSGNKGDNAGRPAIEHWEKMDWEREER